MADNSEVTITINDFAQNGAALGVFETSLATAIRIHAQAVLLQKPKTGQLKNSLMVTSKKGEYGFNTAGQEPAPVDQKLSVKPKQDEVYVGTNSDHWYPEFGTRHQIANPFLRPAVEMVRNNLSDLPKKYAVKAMQDEFKKRKSKTVTK
jgi:hypothetical protein